MNIAPAASGINALYSAKPVSSADKVVVNLERQKNRLQGEIKKIDSGKNDLEAKRRKKEELQKQIEELDKQIAQMKLEKLKEQPEIKEPLAAATAPPAQDSGENLPGGTPLAASNHFLSALSEHSQMKTLGKVRTEAMGKARIAIAQGADPATAMATVNDLDNKIYKKAGEIQKELAKAGKEMADKQAKQKETQEKERQESYPLANKPESDTNGVASSHVIKKGNNDKGEESFSFGRPETDKYPKKTNNAGSNANNIDIEW